ncbi:PaaI family thioesterase [Pseudonocardia spinosispora]|uniref:PaaI family thioesterase n=1 Tax=Pseudonocardia spinosispora TaxID=103441 RepID=UPI00042A681B|nr:PaaI family thioesterase [Pseudonocardia spinosispora]
MAMPEDATLPPHTAQCLGCGPDNPAGLHMEVRPSGEGLVTDVVFDGRLVGAPGVAHGGAVATACDDLFGFLVLYAAGVTAVTRSLQVEYHAPVVLDRSYRITATLDSREGRKLQVSAEGIAEGGTRAFSATALFLAVDLSHFTPFGTFQHNPGLAALLRERD